MSIRKFIHFYNPVFQHDALFDSAGVWERYLFWLRYQSNVIEMQEALIWSFLHYFEVAQNTCPLLAFFIKWAPTVVLGRASLMGTKLRTTACPRYIYRRHFTRGLNDIRRFRISDISNTATVAKFLNSYMPYIHIMWMGCWLRNFQWGYDESGVANRINWSFNASKALLALLFYLLFLVLYYWC